MLKTLVSALLIEQAAGHGWLVQPISQNDLELRRVGAGGMPGDFKYCPHCCAIGNNGAGHYDSPGAFCGANSDVYANGGLSVWQKWYDASGIQVPVLRPGSDMMVEAKIDADHGGQFWFMIACGSQVRDNLPWVILQRAANDRSRGGLPSHPEIYAWPVRSLPGNGTVGAMYRVPASFSCPTGEAVGRWIWKTGNTCNDANNVGRSTTTFSQSENSRIPLTNSVCGSAPETFISCVNFKVEGGNPTPTSAPTPGPPPPPPTPTSAPTPGPPPTPTSAPTPPTGGGCCRFGADCGDCGDDGTGWCHQSASNCATCTGSFDSSGSAPSCGGGSPPRRRSAAPSPPPTPPTTGGRCCYGGGCSSCNGAGEYCSSSVGACQNDCGGTYCSASSLSMKKVVKHE